LIEDGENGFLFEVGDYKELSKKIETLLNNKELITTFGKRLSQKAKEKFSAENMAKMQFEIYKKIIQKI